MCITFSRLSNTTPSLESGKQVSLLSPLLLYSVTQRKIPNTEYTTFSQELP